MRLQKQVQRINPTSTAILKILLKKNGCRSFITAFCYQILKTCIFLSLTLMKEYRVFPYIFRNSALMSSMSISALATIILIRTLSVVPRP